LDCFGEIAPQQLLSLVGHLFESSGDIEQSGHIAVSALSVQLLTVVSNLGEDFFVLQDSELAA